MTLSRLSTGVPGLDELLGGGLLPGTLTVISGATGIGKTQLGVQFAAAGLTQEGQRGIVFDLSSRGDAQSHADYARRMFSWELRPVDPNRPLELDGFFDHPAAAGDYLHVFDRHGRRVTRGDLGFEAWQEWNAELERKLAASIAFFYGNFLRGVRRAVIDGIEPVGRASESIQIELFEYVYHQILRKEPAWVARDLFRQKFRENAERVGKHTYDNRQIACVLLYTSSEVMLEELAARPLEEGDILAGANTIIYLGKVRHGNRLSRGLYIAKHRGSACADEIVPYTILDGGLRVG
ncbi:MAG: recombinase RecA [Planctomycetia bacterium]|nr:recombinase RecA [Planctomycetia bacterium]